VRTSSASRRAVGGRRPPSARMGAGAGKRTVRRKTGRGSRTAERTYPTSREWEVASGLLLSDCDDKQEQHERIRRLGLPNLRFLRYDGDDRRIERFIRDEKPVCLVATGRKTRRVKLGAREPEEFAAFRRETSADDEWEFFVGNMVEALPHSYVGTAVSDGRGRIYMEFLVRPYLTEIRELTAGVCDPRDLARCYVEEFSDVILSTPHIPPSDLRYLRHELGGIRGYFEFIKGLCHREPGIYFLQYERTRAFTNLLDSVNSTDRFHFDLGARVASAWTKWYLQ